MINLDVKFQMLSFSISFVIAMKPNVKENICFVVILLSAKYYHNKSSIFCTHIIYYLRTLNYLVLPPDEFVQPCENVGVNFKPLKMDLTEGPETSANIILTLGKHPKDNTVNTEHSESLKSRMLVLVTEGNYEV
jgi:hypothetical protein